MSFVIVSLRPLPGPVWKAYVELVNDEASRTRGLSHRATIESGMLFEFNPPESPSFWMRDTHQDLDILWISPNNLVIGIERMQAESDCRHTPPVPIRYALELPAGTVARAGITPGAIFSLENP